MQMVELGAEEVCVEEEGIVTVVDTDFVGEARDVIAGH